MILIKVSMPTEKKILLNIFYRALWNAIKTKRFVKKNKTLIYTIISDSL
jgi:hypothetical protein